MASAIVNEHVRYEPEETPPPLIALGAGAQAAMLIVAPVVLTVVVVVRIADASGRPVHGTDPAAAPLVAVVTLTVLVAMVLRAPPSLRLWSPVAGIAAGSAVGAPFGLYDVGAVADAAWFGVPVQGWPGLDLTPDANFWALLPAFIVVTLVGAIETIGEGQAECTILHAHAQTA